MEEIEGEDAALFGRVADEQGQPVANASVAIIAGPGPAPDLAAVTNRDGWFAFGDPAYGCWTLRAYAQDGRMGEGEAAAGDLCLIIVRRQCAGADTRLRSAGTDLDNLTSMAFVHRDSATPDAQELSTPESD